jgi:molybdopterin synthase catalytic subunit
VFVGVCSSDSEAAVQACLFLTKAVRVRAPFWRKEILAGGGSRWASTLSDEKPA